MSARQGDPARIAPRGAYAPNQAELARETKDRAGWRCQLCGHPHDVAAGRSLAEHHLDGNRAHNVEWNRVAVCQQCHCRIHNDFPAHHPLTTGQTIPLFRGTWHANLMRLLARYRRCEAASGGG